MKENEKLTEVTETSEKVEETEVQPKAVETSEEALKEEGLKEAEKVEASKTEEVSEEEKPEKVEEVEEKKEEDVPESTEEKVPEEVEEPESTEPEPTEEKEEVSTEEKEEEPPVEEVNAEAEEKEKERIAKMRKELEELQEEKAIRQKVIEFSQTKQRAETEFYDFCAKLQSSVESEFKRLGIDVNKNFDELTELEKSQANQLLGQAEAMKRDAASRVARLVDETFNDVVFTKAEKIFKNYPMTATQQQIAAKSFVNIMNTIGIQDLSDDITEKVKYSVARALMEAPAEKEVVEEPAPAPVVEEVPEQLVDEQLIQGAPEAETKKEEAPEVAPQKGEAPAEPQLEQSKSDYMDGLEGSNSPTQSLNEDNVLDKLASLPYRERSEFYKENFELIERAAKKHFKG